MTREPPATARRRRHGHADAQKRRSPGRLHVGTISPAEHDAAYWATQAYEDPDRRKQPSLRQTRSGSVRQTMRSRNTGHSSFARDDIDVFECPERPEVLRGVRCRAGVTNKLERPLCCLHERVAQGAVLPALTTDLVPAPPGQDQSLLRPPRPKHLARSCMPSQLAHSCWHTAVRPQPGGRRLRSLYRGLIS